jgi:hypothetical protein
MNDAAARLPSGGHDPTAAKRYTYGKDDTGA